jgi:hypothetical protein
MVFDQSLSPDNKNHRPRHGMQEGRIELTVVNAEPWGAVTADAIRTVLQGTRSPGSQ